MTRLVPILQGLLALVFLAHGVMFLFPPAEVAAQMDASLPRWFQLFLGVAEVGAAAGLTLPAWTGIQTWLVPAAAVGIMIVMVGATALHIARIEIGAAAITAVLLVMATYVAYVRARVVSSRSRVVRS